MNLKVRKFEDLKWVIKSRKSKTEQTIQWPKEKEQNDKK
jgi:hypothetical protein